LIDKILHNNFKQKLTKSLIKTMTKVVLIASDQTKFEVDEQVAKKSQLLKNMIEDTGC
jgi:peptidyl-tRNA hydrolase